MLELHVVTPTRQLLEVHCQAVSVPGENGEFEVLEGHTPLLSAVKTGVLTIKEIDRVTKADVEYLKDGERELRLMVSGGFAEVDDKCVKVLCEHAAMPSEVDRASEEEQLKDLEDKLKSMHPGSDDEEFGRLEAEVERTAARLRII